MMNEGRILALDVGSKRTGVAVSDPSRSIATPVKFIESQENKKWLCEIESLVTDYEVQTVLVGIPLNQDGSAGAAASEVQKLIALLRERVSLPVIEWDERFTTAQAERILLEADVKRNKRKQVIDKLAATILLQSYLDSLQFDPIVACNETEI